MKYNKKIKVKDIMSITIGIVVCIVFTFYPEFVESIIKDVAHIWVSQILEASNNITNDFSKSFSK